MCNGGLYVMEARLQWAPVCNGGRGRLYVMGGLYAIEGIGLYIMGLYVMGRG